MTEKRQLLKTFVDLSEAKAARAEYAANLKRMGLAGTYGVSIRPGPGGWWLWLRQYEGLERRGA